ncbi:Triacylglycerol lipase (LipA), putative [Penicillium digitatum PHI26]|uniref:Carboxylic ester hydrolase n=2 Tax=Penicillium digitatum TaxID=36651 RepID=K9GS82_PEND2|nr:Triacylglycerol lipase (LipA), putative [Penicillium digitatum Pd1]EKV15926.1 Triacylglycerol lipase (LipA), putative [Penicillium digitatum PHI26]EKV20597.1 Triacylglycerol lipase (LipA), putative [Penicillium digitatum Pd1]
MRSKTSTTVLLSTSILSIISGATASPISSKTTRTAANPPTATLSTSNKTPNTIFVGRSLPEFNQDLFLGIKYADEPSRFTPVELKSIYASKDSNSGPYDPSQAGLSTASNSIYYNATEYGYDCPAYGSDTNTLIKEGLVTLNEDCFNLNIIRPIADENNGLLPVLLWIFGGGWTQGATADPRYNMSYIVEQSALNGKPVLGVSINYRLAAFGFLDSEEVRAEGNTNLALRDQRTAMRWVKKNIEAFGGDPSKITIWGESAGAYSVGAHLVTNNGDNEGLFRAAIMDSGNAVGPPYNGTEWHQPMYDRIVERAGCTTSKNTLQCLRELPYATLYSIANEGQEWFATVDGSFIAQYPQISYREGKLAQVPILIGTNTDEGTSFGTTGTNTDEDCINQLTTSKRWVLDRSQATKLLSFYPDIPAIGCPYGWGNTTWPSLGLMYKRYESIAGDVTQVAPRRMLAQRMASFRDNVYSYRWDVAAFNSSTTIGVQHFAEIPFVFANPVQTITPLGSDPARLELGQMAARMWTSFAADLDPNGHGVSDIAEWPTYSSRATNFVFRLPRKESYVEADTYRVDGIDYINSIAR